MIQEVKIVIQEVKIVIQEVKIVIQEAKIVIQEVKIVIQEVKILISFGFTRLHWGGYKWVKTFTKEFLRFIIIKIMYISNHFTF